MELATISARSLATGNYPLRVNDRRYVPVPIGHLLDTAEYSVADGLRVGFEAVISRAAESRWWSGGSANALWSALYEWRRTVRPRFRDNDEFRGYMATALFIALGFRITRRRQGGILNCLTIDEYFSIFGLGSPYDGAKDALVGFAGALPLPDAYWKLLAELRQSLALGRGPIREFAEFERSFITLGLTLWAWGTGIGAGSIGAGSREEAVQAVAQESIGAASSMFSLKLLWEQAKKDGEIQSGEIFDIIWEALSIVPYRALQAMLFVVDVLEQIYDTAVDFAKAIVSLYDYVLYCRDITRGQGVILGGDRLPFASTADVLGVWPIMPTHGNRPEPARFAFDPDVVTATAQAQNRATAALLNSRLDGMETGSIVMLEEIDSKTLEVRPFPYPQHTDPIIATETRPRPTPGKRYVPHLLYRGYPRILTYLKRYDPQVAPSDHNAVFKHPDGTNWVRVIEIVGLQELTPQAEVWQQDYSKKKRVRKPDFIAIEVPVGAAEAKIVNPNGGAVPAESYSGVINGAKLGVVEHRYAAFYYLDWDGSATLGARLGHFDKSQVTGLVVLDNYLERLWFKMASGFTAVYVVQDLYHGREMPLTRGASAQSGLPISVRHEVFIPVVLSTMEIFAIHDQGNRGLVSISPEGLVLRGGMPVPLNRLAAATPQFLAKCEKILGAARANWETFVRRRRR